MCQKSTEGDKTTPKASVSKRQRIGARAFIGTFGTSIFLQGCMLAQGMIVARLLGPDGRGQFAAIVLWPNILANIGLFGVSFSVARIAAKIKDVGSIARSGLLLSLIMGVITGLVGFLFIDFLIPEEQNNILPLARLYMLFIPLYQLIANLTAIDQGSGNFLRLNIFRSIQSPIFIVFLCVIYIFGVYDIKWFVIVFLLSFGVVALGRLILMLSDYSLMGRLYSLAQILKDSTSFGLVGVVVQGYYYIDRILLLWLLQPRDMGLYVVALAAGSLLRSITTSMGLVAFTITAQESISEGFDRVSSIFRKAVVTKFFLGIVLSLALPILLPLVYGSDFADAVVPGIVLITGSALAGLALFLDQCMRGQGKPYAGLIARIIAIIIMVLFGYPLSRFYTVLGISIAFVLAQAVYVFALIVQLLNHYTNSKALLLIPRLDDIRQLITLGIKTVRKAILLIFPQKF